MYNIIRFSLCMEDDIIQSAPLFCEKTDCIIDVAWDYPKLPCKGESLNWYDHIPLQFLETIDNKERSALKCLSDESTVVATGWMPRFNDKDERIAGSQYIVHLGLDNSIRYNKKKSKLIINVYHPLFNDDPVEIGWHLPVLPSRDEYFSLWGFLDQYTVNRLVSKWVYLNLSGLCTKNNEYYDDCFQVMSFSMLENSNEFLEACKEGRDLYRLVNLDATDNKAALAIRNVHSGLRFLLNTARLISSVKWDFDTDFNQPVVTISLV